MNKNRIAAFAFSASLSVFAVGCQTTPTTTNANINGNTVPSNVAVATNNNGNTNTAGITTTDNRYNTNVNANITRAEYDRDRDRYTREAKEAGSTVGSGVEDGWLHTKTRAALLTTDDLRESTINVDVNNNVVTLRGSVETAAQRTKAETVAKGIDGVKSVVNNLQIKPNDSMMNANANMNGNRNMNGNMNGNMNANGNMRRP